MSDHAVVADHVSKRFRLFKEKNNSLKATIMRGRRVVAEDFWAVKDVSFEVPKGEAFGLIGENGSGKSTMLKCLTRIYRPESGRIAINGKVSALLELGAGFHPELSGRENVFLNGAILGLSQKELRQRFDAIVDFAGIGKFIDEPVKNYSSGMYVRLGFSVAINVDPEVLLVDEVLAVGDEAFQRKCNEKFADLKADGKTIILVSHAMSAVQNMCDRVAWFEHGELKEVGDAREVIEHYTGSVQVERDVDESGRPHWGSGEGQITRAELIGAEGEVVERLVTGAPGRIRLHYEMREPVAQPVFSMYLSTINGQPVSGPNSRAYECVPDKLDGRGYVDLCMDEVRLLPGTYDLTPLITDITMMKVLDQRQNLLRFDVERGGLLREDWGVTTLSPRWEITPGS
ncbi:ATP-binding cassette domain-containing protein [Acidimicrobiaceae bacterium USS-CC1]|uniref:ATP-binding cassette domain-containing protein n=1 Tax=Acidiferrimicrobium australe TaxID=2664430 RepID=A0ABW9QRF4_9ACTN|nr:ATP-binding cassette domain-containing protein [Acidiferrimicrobium australe]